MWSARRLARLVGVTLVTLAVATEAYASIHSIPTEDRNRDGRPDVWRVDDGPAGTSHIALDTNFDGRSDVHEYYDAGVLVLRESDRDFNNRIDLVQSFDLLTHDCASALIDEDFDGTADLLVLFRNGRPVATRFAQASSGSTSRYDAPVALVTGSDLAPLYDPFASDPALTSNVVTPDAGDCAGVTTAGGLPSEADLPALSQARTTPRPRDTFAAIGDFVSARSPRGPPARSTRS